MQVLPQQVQQGGPGGNVAVVLDAVDGDAEGQVLDERLRGRIIGDVVVGHGRPRHTGLRDDAE